MSAPIILDGNGRPYPLSAGSGFGAGNGTGGGWDAGGYDTHRTSNWLTTSASMNALVTSGETIALRDRARDALRNDPVAVSAMNAFVSNAVGTGIKPLPRVEDDTFRKEIAEAWEEFATEIDADGVTDFYGMQSLAVRAMRESGDAFFRFRPRKEEFAEARGLSVPLQLQLIESDFLDIGFNENKGRRTIRSGIEFDRNGQRVAYHMWRQHPNDLFQNFGGRNRIRIRESEILHMFEVKRPGQVRGVSAFAPILTKLNDLKRYDDAELLRKELAAMFAAFERTPSIESQDPIGGGSLGYGVMSLPLAHLEAGTYQRIPPGHDITFSDPADITGQYEMFFTVQLRLVAMALGIMYEQLSGDWKQVTFSSARAALIEFRRAMKQFQRLVIIHQLCRPVYRRWFETALLSGRLTLPAGMELASAMRVQWVPTPGFETVDPAKELSAIEKQLRLNLRSRSSVIAESGEDALTVDREIAEDQERLQSLGIKSEDERVAEIMADDAKENDDNEISDERIPQRQNAG